MIIVIKAIGLVLVGLVALMCFAIVLGIIAWLFQKELNPEDLINEEE